MPGHGRRSGRPLAGLLALCLAAAAFPLRATVAADFRDLERETPPSTVSPLQADAALHAIQFVGEKKGWAVGDHGVIWHTADGGAHWDLQPSGVGCPLRSVCFLSDRVGWAAGGGGVPFTRLRIGVLLFTRDGGTTWKELAREELPELHQVQFFNLEQGLAISQGNSRFPSGVLVTADGGATWQPLPGDESAGWRAGDFVREGTGVIAGARGQIALLNNGSVLKPRTVVSGLRGVRAVDISSGGHGWMAGDGGLLRHTTDGGLVWDDPVTMLPERAAELFDFRAICFRGQRGWVAGQPGSVIWHTPDGGKTWQRQATRQPLPIHALAFSSDTHGWAVGAMGQMLETSDGGETWRQVRGKSLRAAYLALHARPEQVSLNLITRLSGEAGYRGVVSLVPRHDLGPDGHASLNQDVRLQETVALLGGSAASIDWQFPLDVHGLDHDPDRLLAEWNRHSEGRLAERLVGHLVCQLRTWRPSVLILDEPAPGDAVTRLMQDAILRAIEAAADATRFLEHRELAELSAWQVSKLYVRLPHGSAGEARIDPHEFLPHAGATVSAATAVTVGQWAEITAAPVAETYRSLPLARVKLAEAGGDFFRGLSLNPGSDARRASATITDDDLEKKLQIARKQRNFHAYVDRNLSDPRQAGQLIAQLDGLTTDMPAEQAALQLLQLAASYRQLGQWELAESTLVRLVERFPDSGPAREAMRWLLQMWAGLEPSWRRARPEGMVRQRVTTDMDDITTRFRNATEGRSRIRTADGTDAEEPDIRPAGGVALNAKPLSSQLQFDKDREWRTQSTRNRQDQARRMAKLLDQNSPTLASSPEIQFPLAALLRQRERSSDAAQIYHAAERGSANDPWQQAAAAELWLLTPVGVPQRPLVICRRTQERPLLDGDLTDECWQTAERIILRGEGNDLPATGVPPTVALCYDDEYLYWGASLPRDADDQTPAGQPQGRTRDADLAAFERLIGLFDVDRDYITYYRFAVDRRGWTAEDCWDDRTWNPGWFVAAQADEQYWRIEVAIPFSELTPLAPQSNSIWNVSFTRIIPARAVEGWPLPASTIPRLETAAFLRFE